MSEQAQVVAAYVVDNTRFANTGEIKVQVSKLRSAVFAEVMTPVGGMPNMAMQWVPPIGASGYVLYKNGDDRKPVWIGAKLLPWDAAGATELADVDIKQGVVEADDPLSDFIIKTQNNTFENQDMDDAENNKVENILKMSKGEFTLAKVQQNDKYQYLKDNYDVKAQTNYQIITMQDDKIVVRFNSSKTDGEGSELIMTEGETQLKSSYGEKSALITLNESGVTIDSDTQTTIYIDNQGNISITGKKMVVDADKIELGGNSEKAVLHGPVRDFINQIYMNHTHPTPSGPSGPPSKSKINIASKKVKLE